MSNSQYNNFKSYRKLYGCIAFGVLSMDSFGYAYKAHALSIKFLMLRYPLFALTQIREWLWSLLSIIFFQIVIMGPTQ